MGTVYCESCREPIEVADEVEGISDIWICDKCDGTATAEEICIDCGLPFYDCICPKPIA